MYCSFAVDVFRCSALSHIQFVSSHTIHYRWHCAVAAGRCSSVIMGLKACVTVHACLHHKTLARSGMQTLSCSELPLPPGLLPVNLSSTLEAPMLQQPKACEVWVWTTAKVVTGLSHSTHTSPLVCPPPCATTRSPNWIISQRAKHGNIFQVCARPSCVLVV